ncbi:MAG: hypothetical protein SGI99_11465 [Pseudomonadota bacterium]|nr:hypothetical protein [Pseudomonadota bacterium]
MSAEVWEILPHERVPFERRIKLLLGVPVTFGDLMLVLLRDRQVNGEPSAVRMVWELRNTGRIETTAVTAVDLAANGRWLPVAVSSFGTVMFNVESPAWPLIATRQGARGALNQPMESAQ